MKRIFALLACLLISGVLSAQTNPNEVFLHSKDHYYASLRNDTAFIYVVWTYYDRHSDVIPFRLL